jgi:hypothetical protein
MRQHQAFRSFQFSPSGATKALSGAIDEIGKHPKP